MAFFEVVSMPCAGEGRVERARARRCSLVSGLVAAAALGTLGACDGGQEVVYEAGPDTGVGASTDASAEAALDAGPGQIGAPYGPSGCPSPCPSASPANAEPCSLAGLECEYGSAFDARCNVTARCVSGAWNVLAPSASCGWPVGCPSSPFGPERGRACAREGVVCAYPDGVCDCERESAGSTAIVWRCSTFTCKGPRPRLGCSCASELVCQYGACAAGEVVHATDVSCRGGVWTRPEACRSVD